MSAPVNQLRLETCVFCGEHFSSKRNDRKTCSGRCRTRLARWRKRLDLHEKKASLELAEIASYLRYPDSVPSAVAALRTLKQEIDDLYKQAGIVKVA